MAQARPISMVMWAILMFLLGGLSIFASLGGFVTANQAMSHPLASLQVGSSAIAMLGIHLRRDSWHTTVVAQKLPECPSLEGHGLRSLKSLWHMVSRLKWIPEN